MYSVNQTEKVKNKRIHYRGWYNQTTIRLCNLTKKQLGLCKCFLLSTCTCPPVPGSSLIVYCIDWQRHETGEDQKPK